MSQAKEEGDNLYILRSCRRGGELRHLGQGASAGQRVTDTCEEEVSRRRGGAAQLYHRAAGRAAVLGVQGLKRKQGGGEKSFKRREEK